MNLEITIIALESIGIYGGAASGIFNLRYGISEEVPVIRELDGELKIQF